MGAQLALFHESPVSQGSDPGWLRPDGACAPGAIGALSSRPVLAAQLFGAMEVTLDGRAVDTAGSRRTRGLIAALVVERGHRLSREALMDRFWPDARPEAARNSLNVTICGARRALRDAWHGTVIEYRQGCYAIARDVTVWSDLAEFERQAATGDRAVEDGEIEAATIAYEVAVNLSAQDLFADDPYVEWMLDLRDAVRLRVLEVRDRLAERYVDQNMFGSAITASRQVLALDPCDERAHRRLMRSFAAIGQRQLAVHQYHRCIDVLRNELGVTPARETHELGQSLETNDAYSLHVSAYRGR